jgi:hypothetical protein
MTMEGGSDVPVVQHNRQWHRSDLGSRSSHDGSRYSPCAAAAQEAARCANRQPHAQGYRRRTGLDYLAVICQWIGFDVKRGIRTPNSCIGSPTLPDDADRKAAATDAPTLIFALQFVARSH